MFEHNWAPASLGVLYACVLYICIFTCSAQLSMFDMERRFRNRLIIIIIIFKLAMVIDYAWSYIWILLWVTLTFIQGHLGTRKRKRVRLLSHNFYIYLNGI